MNRFKNLLPTVFAVCLFAGLIVGPSPSHLLAQDSQPSKEEPPKRKPAHVMSYRGASWLERATRAQEEQPRKLIAAMKLEPGDVVADIGCGSGYYARRIARVVGPEGKVYGVDIQPEMLQILREFMAREGIENIEPVLGEGADPKLPPESVDWMILVDVYHEFQDPGPMLAKMREALKPDGKVALAEYRLYGRTAAHIKLDHRMSVEQVRGEWEPAGYKLLELNEDLPTQHLFIFGKSNLASESAPPLAVETGD